MGLELKSHSFGTTSIKTLEGGSGGSRVLFLHGEEGLRHNRPFLEELAGQHPVIAPYHPGFAGSERKKLPSNMSELITIYLYLLRGIVRQDNAPVILIGAGFGGWLAVELAIRSPAEVAALCLIAPLGIRTRPPGEREIADVFNMDLPALRATWFAGETDDFLNPNKMEEQDWMSLAQDREGLALYAWIPYMHDPALAGALGLIKASTLCLWNSGDTAVRAGYYADFAGRIRNVRTAVLDGAGHFPLLTDRRSCTAALQDFLQSTPAVKFISSMDARR